MSSAGGRHDGIDEEAATWLAALDSGRADRAAFERWRAAEPAHALAFIRADRLWRDLDRLGHRGHADVTSAAAPEDAVRPSRRGALAAAGAVAAIAAGGGVVLATQAAASTVETAVGERRRFYVATGACLDLNTASRLRWWRSADGLEIELERGELSVDRAAGAPVCVLHAGDARFRLGNGRFNARLRDGDAVELATVAGEARMLEPRARLLPARETLLVTDAGDRARRLSDTDVRALAAWQEGELLLAGEPLRVAVAEFNRYLPTPLVLDGGLGEERLGGRFLTSDPAAFLEALRIEFGIRAEPQPDRIVLRR